jgi:hypothetical protein
MEARTGGAISLQPTGNRQGVILFHESLYGETNKSQTNERATRCGKAPNLDQAKRELAIKIREVNKRRNNNEDDEDNNYGH